jgi:hypothetical protein
MYLKLKPNLVLSLERGNEREDETLKKWTWMREGEGE